VDPSALALAEARRTLHNAGLGRGVGAVEVRQMDGRALALPNGAFAAAVSSRVLIHAPEPERIVAEMARVVQPQGRVLCIEPAVQVAAGVDNALRRKVSAWTNPDIGQLLPGIMRRAGLRDVTVHPIVHVATDPPNVQAWRDELARGEGLRAAALHDGLCTREEVEELFRQNEDAIRRGVWLECSVHFGVLGRKAL
jgi:SAM-dependent methyltransferase